MLYIVGEEGFYNIAHMVNTKSAVDWALDQGANAVEIDVAFNSFSGALKEVKHGTPCDCTCACPAPAWGICSSITGFVCSVLKHGVTAESPCNGKSTFIDMLRHLASKNELALIVIDSKIEESDMSKNAMRRAGKNIVKALNMYLFGAGYAGKVIVGTPKLNTLPYLEEAVAATNTFGGFKGKVYFTADMEKDNIESTLEKLHTLPTQNIVYGTGISACALKSSISDSTVEQAFINKVRGVAGMAYIWTIDKTSSMESYLPYVQGIMTNYPGTLYEVLKKAGIELATQSSTIPATTSSRVITKEARYRCDCNYHPGGCSISRPAPTGMACKCKYKGHWTCEGNIVQCRDPSNEFCLNPDKSVNSCMQGSGDCDGYKTSHCDCDYHPGGCAISRASPPDTACRCVFKGARTCKGELTRCKNETSPLCSKPDKSVYSCILGGGDCDGYENAKCDCDYHPGGCSISQAATLANTACKCIYLGGWRCRGDVVHCDDPNSHYCKNPDKSVYSCFQGNGDCEGYKTATCDCDYHPGGCTISKAPPRNTACKCSYTWLWTCRGDITKCRHTSDYYCRYPDTSKRSCFLGRGDCGGY